MKNVVTNQKGMSLVSVLIAAGLMSMLALVLADMTVMMTKTSVTAQANADQLGLVSQIRTSMQDPARSTNMLKTNRIDGGTIIIYDPLVPSTIVAAAEMRLSKSDAFKIRRVGFENITPTINANQYKITVTLIFEKDANRTIGPAITRKVVGDVYCYAPGNVITDCSGATDPVEVAKNQCTALGGVWDSTTKCTLRTIASDPTGDHNCDGHSDNGKGDCK